MNGTQFVEWTSFFSWIRPVAGQRMGTTLIYLFIGNLSFSLCPTLAGLTNAAEILIRTHVNESDAHSPLPLTSSKGFVETARAMMGLYSINKGNVIHNIVVLFYSVYNGQFGCSSHRSPRFLSDFYVRTSYPNDGYRLSLYPLNPHVPL